MKLTDLPLDRPVATAMLLLCVTVLGTVAIFFLPLDYMPVVNEPEIDIRIPYPGSHPLESLRRVVRPVEEEVAAIPGVRGIFGFARQGEAVVEVNFDWSVDVDIKKMEVREAVERIRGNLPAEIDHIRVEGDTDGPGAQILGGRISARKNLSESWDLLDRKIRRPLERIKGVARVELYGVDPKQVRVDLDLIAVERHGVTVSSLIELINAANLDMDLGAIRGTELRYDVRTAARFRDVEALRRLNLGVGGLRLEDVADVQLREPELNRGRHLNRDFAIGFDVYKEPTANTVQTVARVTDKIAALGADPELQGITVVEWQNQGKEILQSLGGLRNAGAFGGAMAVAVLFFFLRRPTTTLIVAVAIPFSLLVTCGCLYALGFNLNVLTMLGLMLGVGMLVDNAVVVIENIFRLQGQGLSAREAARAGTRQVALAVVAATATTIIVWSWLFVIEPNEMQIYIGQVATAICLSVACSLLVSLTFIPMMASRLRPRAAAREGFLLSHVVPRYRSLLRWTIARGWRRAVVLFLLLLVASSAALPISWIEKSGEPIQQTNDVLIVYQIHDPATLAVLEAHVNQVEDWLDARRAEWGIEYIYSWFSEEFNSAQTRIYLPRERAGEKEYRELTARLRAGLPDIPGVELDVGDHRGRSRGPQRGGFVSLAVHGEDPDYLQTVAEEVEERMRVVDHVLEVYGPSLVGSKEVRVHVDPERADRLGLTPDFVASAVSTAFRGNRLRRFQGPRGEIELVLGLPETARPGVAALETLPLPLAGGANVPLGALATFEEARTPPQIQRIDRKTTSRVSVQFDDEATTTQEMRERMTAAMVGLRLPDGYHWDWGREERRHDEALGIMLRGVLISLMMVVLLMAALFESLSQPLAILITLPLALFGAFWSLWLFGFVFEILAFIGIIILIGLVVNNGIVMVDHVNALRRAGSSREQALTEGCGDRLRPVLMTVITTVVGLTPLAFSQFSVAGVYIQTLAVAMIGGLLSSTLFTLLALPVWYTAVEDIVGFTLGLLPAWSPGSGATLPRGNVLLADAPRGARPTEPKS